MILGGEVEYAVYAEEQDGTRVPDRTIGELIVDELAKRTPSVPCADTYGTFAEFGRFYLDRPHDRLEFASAETQDPWTLVATTCVAERELVSAAAAVREAYDFNAVEIARIRVDYRLGTSWGAHENYSVTHEHEAYARVTVSHVASRVVFAGEGGFPCIDGGPRFVLAPRALHITRTHSVDSEGRCRPMVHLRQEHLDVASRRVHLISSAGAALCSKPAVWLTFGTTALLLRLLDLGYRPPRGTILVSPVEALHAYTLDPALGARARTEAHDSVNAIQHQSRLQRWASTLAAASGLPWADAVCRGWGQVLADLAARRWHRLPLDWVLKQRLAKALLDEPGCHAAKLQEFDYRFGLLGPEGLFHRIEAALPKDWSVCSTRRVEAAAVGRTGVPRAETRGRWIRQLWDQGRDVEARWDEIVDYEEGLLHILPSTSSGASDQVTVNFFSGDLWRPDDRPEDLL